jgi:hypothetical protein
LIPRNQITTRGGPIDCQDAVEMVYLVLPQFRERALCLKLPRRSRAVETGY